MKPLERIFFIACINEQRRVCDLGNREFSIRVIGNIFERIGFSYKQLMYYVQKWSDRGFYDYGVTLDLGWFNFDKLNGEYLEIYKSTTITTNWKDGEFAEYITKQTFKGKATNAYVKTVLGIADEGFY